MARILIVGGGCPGRRFARRMVEQGHAVRITTRTELGRTDIEHAGAECWIGTPDRLATLRGALENVTVACWMLARVHGDRGEVAALHSSRLEFFLGQAIDTTVRGLIYDASPGRLPPELLNHGEEIFSALTRLNAIPAVVLGGPALRQGRDAEDREGAGEGVDEQGWVAEAGAAVEGLLTGPR